MHATAGIKIDDQLMRSALATTGLRTKTAVVEEALKLLTRMNGQERIRELRDKIHWERSRPYSAQSTERREMRPILVDSPVWIDFFADCQAWAVEELDRMFGREELYMADLILMEILQGVSSRREQRVVDAKIGILPCHNLGEAERARSAAANYRLLRSFGRHRARQWTF